jgi:colicin import membrane protein
MEALVKRKQVVLATVVAVAGAAGLAGCKDDSAAIQALQELTTQLSQQVADQNDALTSMTEKVQGCMKDLATTKGEAVVITSKDAGVDVPSLEGEASVASLEALKKALNETVEKQKNALAELEASSKQCVADLEAARAAQEAAAKAKAEAEAAAKQQAADSKRKAADKKPTAVKKAEEAGTPTKGVRSRY